MKGIILSGGNGTRLSPITDIISKQLVPVYDKPMIYYPISTLLLAGVDDILIICNKEHLNNYKSLLGDGSKIGIKFSYMIQEEPLGLAHGLKMAESFFEDYSDEDPFIFALGDNIVISDNVEQTFKESFNSLNDGNLASIFSIEVSDPSSFGVVTFKNDKPESIEEKPLNPQSSWAIPGFYVYQKSVFKYISKLTPSSRGELEITDLNKIFLDENKLNVVKFGRSTIWYDAGSCDDLFEISEIVKNLYKRSGKIIGCLEEIAINRGLIDKEEIHISNKNSHYQKYVRALAE